MAGLTAKELRLKAFERITAFFCVELDFLGDLLPELHVAAVCQVFLALEGGSWMLDPAQVYRECRGAAQTALDFFARALDSGPAFSVETLTKLASTAHTLLGVVPEASFGDERRRLLVEEISRQR